MSKKIFVLFVIICAVVIGLFFLGMKKGNFCPLKSDSGVSLSGLLNQAKAAQAKADSLGAKEAYQKLVNEFPSAKDVMSWQKKIEEINMALLFSPQVTPKSRIYEIKAGDTLTKIAREFKTTPELIMKSNNLSSDRISPGKKIKVWDAPFSIFVDKSQNTLLLLSGEEIIKAYTVSTGKDNCTPVGNFKITDKLINPTWFKAGAVVASGSPENILGTRWMGINVPGYGIHGTVDPQNLGKQVTQGCVRMSNSEVEELYTIVPVGTEVTIVD